MTHSTMEKLPVRFGSSGQFPNPMTKEQARRLGNRIMPKDLQRAGFVCTIFRSDPEIHGGNWFRILYGKTF